MLLRRADDRRRFVASQRAGRIDPNPHQIDAVMFALQRIPLGGCILADEVGLGKTIEAGLVIAQLLAEGATRILLMTPKPLLGQWKQELSTLFGIDALEGQELETGFEGAGVFVVGREYAGSEAGAERLIAGGNWDLAVIDEAHEMFAGIYRRYDRHGGATNTRYAKTAARVKAVLSGVPVVLLTATPIQNTLTELWGLAQYVEPTETLFGDLPTFRTLFCDGDDRRLRAGQDQELRSRVASICQRTLRRQAQEFMQTKFVRRTARLFEYEMSAEEQALYDEVTAYLLDPGIFAFDGGNRRLLLISFHRRMGSSVRALADSLETVADRLARRLTGKDDATMQMFADDLEDDDDVPVVPSSDDPVTVAPRRLEDELKRVTRLAQRARSLSVDSKARQAIAAIRMVLARGDAQEGSGKVVIFTEAISTQDYLRDVLIASGALTDDQITLFRGQNTGPRVQAALARWQAEVGERMPVAVRPSPSVAVRLALVHEFATRSVVFISTEAGAKGLNLQFCDTVINYDLPWNPQRIEQRIGRCHRYGQTRDVTVVNFLARGNEAQRLTFEILSRKLDLFGTVLDASDAVLHESTSDRPAAWVGALASDFESMLADAYAKARTPDELQASLEQVRDEIGTRQQQLDETRARTEGLIEHRFDETVRAAFTSLREDVPDGLAEFDQALENVVVRYLNAIEAPYRRVAFEGGCGLEIDPSLALPAGLQDGARVWIGPTARCEDADAYEPLHLGHRLIHAALEEARHASQGSFVVCASVDASDGPMPQAGRLVVLKTHYAGFEPVEGLVPVFVPDEQERDVMASRQVAELFDGVMAKDVNVAQDGPLVSDEDLQDAIDEVLFVAQADVDAREQQHFDAAIERIERTMDDKVLVIRQAQRERAEQLEVAQARREAASGADMRNRWDAECRAIQAEIDTWETEALGLVQRDDSQYQEWIARAYARRYAPPTCERIIDARVRIVHKGGA